MCLTKMEAHHRHPHRRLNTRQQLRVKRLLAARSLCYWDVAAKAKRSWSLVYHVCNGRKWSDPVVRTLQQLTGEVLEG